MYKAVLFTLSFILFFTACSPATEPASTPTPVGFISSSIEAVDKFYKTINEAEKEEDLFAAYMMLTAESMCNPYIFAYCEPSGFQTKWWKSKVAYKLYDCGDNVVISEETRYPRNDDSLATPSAPRFSRFKLAETEDGILIGGVSFTPATDEGCVLAVDHSEIP